MKHYVLIFILLIFFIPESVNAQKWKKDFKSKGKKTLKMATKELKKEIKPVTIDYRVSDISYNPLKSLSKLVLTIDFTGENQNDVGVTLKRTEFDLFADDNLLTKFYNQKKIVISKKDVFNFQETAEISILEAGKTLFSSIIKKSVVYTLVGTFYVDTPFGSFPFDVKLYEKEMNPKEDKKKEKK